MNENQKKEIFDFMAQNMSKNFESLGMISGFELEDIHSLSKVPHFEAPFCSEICLFGSDVTLRLQIYYDMKAAQKYLSEALSDTNPYKVLDFFNEVCNMSYGKIKNIFTEQSFNATLSLPMAFEAGPSYYPEMHQSLPFIDFKNIVKESHPWAHIRTSLEYNQNTDFSHFKCEDNSNDDDGELEFF